MKTAAFCIALTVVASVAGAAESGDDLRQFLAKRESRDAELARSMWEWAEVGYQEVKSSALLQKELTGAASRWKPASPGFRRHSSRRRAAASP